MIGDSIIEGEDGGRAVDEPLVPWWSFTKTVLAGAALALVDAGKLVLDEPISGAPYTIRHLLQHTSGLRDYGPLAGYHAAVAAGVEPWSPENLLRQVRSDELLFEPGTSWAYSNVGYLFVRQIVERATGLKIGAALRHLVLDPLHVHRVMVATTPGDLAQPGATPVATIRVGSTTVCWWDPHRPPRPSCTGFCSVPSCPRISGRGF